MIGDFNSIKDLDDETPLTLDDVKALVRHNLTRRRALLMVKAAFQRAMQGDNAARAWLLSCLVDESQAYYLLPERQRKPIDVNEIKP